MLESRKKNPPVLNGSFVTHPSPSMSTLFIRGPPPQTNIDAWLVYVGTGAKPGSLGFSECEIVLQIVPHHVWCRSGTNDSRDPYRICFIWSALPTRLMDTSCILYYAPDTATKYELVLVRACTHKISIRMILRVYYELFIYLFLKCALD